MIRVFSLIAVALAVATVVGLVVLWPGHVESRVAQGMSTDSERADVTSVREGFCAGLMSQTAGSCVRRSRAGRRRASASRFS